MRKPLVVPEQLHNRNASVIREAGIEHTGLSLIAYAAECLGVAELRDTDVLDVGCGVRFTQTIINHNVPIKSYTGVDVDPKLISFLQREVNDPRFSFAHWDVSNPVYHPTGSQRLSPDMQLPVGGTYDAIWMFSVVTHLDAHDTDAMMAILRRVIRPGGMLLFSTFLNDDINSYAEDDPNRPSAKVYYNERFLRDVVTRSGWQVDAVYPRGTARYIVDHFICRPAP